MLERPIAIWAAPLGMLLVALAAMAFDAGGIASSLRGALFDTYQRHTNQFFAGNAPYRVIETDAANDPEVLARLVSDLGRAGASMVVFTAPVAPGASFKSLLAEIPAGAALDPARTAISSLPEPEEKLVEALASVKAVTGIRLGATGPMPMLKAGFVYQGNKPPFGEVPIFDRAAAASPAIQAASAGLGVLNLSPDADGVVRRMPLMFRLGGGVVPALDAEALRLTEGASVLTVKGTQGGLGAVLGLSPGVAALEARHEIPTEPDGSFWISFGAPPPLLPASLENLPPLGGAVVFVGQPGEQVRTPMGPESIASVEAQGFENLASGHVLERRGNAPAIEALAFVLAAGATILIGVLIAPIWAWLFAIAAIIGGGFASWHFFAAGHLLYDAASPGVGLLLVLAIVTLSRMAEIATARTQLRFAFAESLPPATVETLARRPALLKLEGETRTITYLACGVRGLGRLASALREYPASFTNLIQRVREPLIDEVRAHGGTIDRLTADGFTAFWNAPLDDAAHALHACEAASVMSLGVSRINEIIAQEHRLDGKVLAPIEIGIGIATGEVIAGGLRGHGRAGYSVNGEATGLASRIQLFSPQYGPAVIVSEETASAAERGFAFLEVDLIAPAEGEKPVTLYALLGNPVTRASPKFRALQTFHEHIFQSLRTCQWKKARELIAQCRKLSGASQTLYDLMLARIAYYEKNPPPADWDGAFRPVLK